MDKFKFTYFENWMKPQVIQLFCQEYQIEKGKFENYFNSFYFNVNCQPESIKIVVLDGEIVAGFVSFTLWPYQINGKLLRSFQCGNVIVNSNYRGKGLYNKMLDHFDEIYKTHNVDFVYGFPIKPILKLYLKSGWTNLLNIQWFLFPINPFAKLFKFDQRRFLKYFENKSKEIKDEVFSNGISLFQTFDFKNWRNNFKPFLDQNLVFYYTYSYKQSVIEFELKISERPYLRELLIGNISSNSSDPLFIRKAIKKLKFAAFKSGQVSFLSIAVNKFEIGNKILETIINSFFFEINKSIPFIIKDYSNSDDLKIISNWNLMRQDLDTW
jgi:hypothetical protein